MTSFCRTGLMPSSKTWPCPVCGRTKDGDCRIRSDGSLVLCHHIRTLKPKELENGWQFVRNTTDDRAAVFIPAQAATKPHSTAERSSRLTYNYSESQRVLRLEPQNGKKRFVVEHLDHSTGEWVTSAGTEHWPIYRHQQVMGALRKGEWLLFEVEGEKCADITASGGVVAFSQPGHAHKVQQVTARYQELLEAGAGLIVYLADNDEQGARRAEGAMEAAAAAGLPLTVVQAADVWPGIPEGGSIDDAPGGPAERVAAIYGAVDLEPTWEQRKLLAVRGLKDPLAIHDAKWNLLRDRALEVIQSDRRILEQRQAIKAVATDLNLKLGNAEIDAIYDDLDGALSAYEDPIPEGGEFQAYGQQWLLDELVLVGLNLLVGMPGAGKSRFLVALIRAFLNSQQTFLERKLMDGSKAKVLIIGTDQDRQQWGDLLAEQGLALVVSTEKVDERELKNYKLHPRISLHTSGGGFRLGPDGMRYIRDWCRENPGGLLIIDSLSAVLPPGVKEGDETAGRLMRQIEVARQGNACIATHHCNKQSAMNGELGVYSGSGSGTIDRAVSRHIGLGYDTHIENGREKLHTESPRRIITSQKRAAVNQKVVVEMGPNGSWDYISTAAEDRELKRQQRDGDPTDRLRGWKLAVYQALSQDWRFTSEVTAALPEDRKAKPNAHKQVQECLRDLADDGVIEEDRQGMGETRWRLHPV